MPTARGIRAGAAYVELYANDNRLARGLKRARARLKAFSASAREIGARLTRLSAVFATPLVAGVKVFADFEDQMANVATMLDEPEKHMDRLRKGVRDMSVEFGESSEALAGGLYDILSASVPAEHALDVLAVAARAARAGLTDTKTAADAITTVLNAYGLSAEHAGDVSDLLFSIVKRGKTIFAEIAPSIGNVATIASTAGVSFEEMGAALATMTRNGVQTENAVTALNAILSSFLKPSAEAVEYARQLGFEMSSATIRSEGLAGVFARISKLPPDAISDLFPNVRALKGVLPALQNMEGFLDDMGVMEGRAGASGKAYEKMTGTLGHSLRQLKQSAIVTLSTLGETLAGPVPRAADVVKRWAVNLRELIEKNRDFVIAAAKVVAIVGLVGGVLIAVGTAGSVMAFAFGGIASILSAVGTAFSVIAAIIGVILTPVGLVITAITALAAYILYATGAAGKALSWLGGQFEELKRTALTAGDIALAARVLWLTLKMEWTRGQFDSSFDAAAANRAADEYYESQKASIDRSWPGAKSAARGSASRPRASTRRPWPKLAVRTWRNMTNWTGNMSDAWPRTRPNWPRRKRNGARPSPWRLRSGPPSNAPKLPRAKPDNQPLRRPRFWISFRRSSGARGDHGRRRPENVGRGRDGFLLRRNRGPSRRGALRRRRAYGQGLGGNSPKYPAPP